jgi:hypothetical protein
MTFSLSSSSPINKKSSTSSPSVMNNSKSNISNKSDTQNQVCFYLSPTSSKTYSKDTIFSSSKEAPIIMDFPSPKSKASLRSTALSTELKAEENKCFFKKLKTETPSPIPLHTKPGPIFRQPKQITPTPKWSP